MFTSQLMLVGYVLLVSPSSDCVKPNAMRLSLVRFAIDISDS